jgi:glycosyltransferase involved in cell wall biosynthesis
MNKPLPSVLHVINSLSVGGAERLLSQLVQFQARLGQHVGVLILSEPVDSSKDFILQVTKYAKLYCSGISLRNPRQVFEIARVVRDFQPDIVHVHLYPAQLWTAIASVGLGSHISWVTTEHSTGNRRRGNPLFWFLDYLMYNRYDHILVITKAVRKALLNWVNLSVDKLTLVTNGIDLTQFYPLVETHNTVSQPFTIISVARLQKPKDFLTVLKAISLLSYPIRFQIVGDGVERSSLEKYARQLGISDSVNFLGFRNDIPQLLQDSDASVHSSQFEGLSLAVVEAMSTGLPIIASDVPGLREIVDGNGLLFPFGDVEALRNHLESLKNNIKLKLILREKSLRKAQEFSIEYTARDYMSVYTDLFFLKVGSK